ncbi:Inositol polyphosphate 5-phosphatase [Entamoeba marina]
MESIQQSIARMDELDQMYQLQESEEEIRESALLYWENPDEWRYKQFEKFSSEYRDENEIFVSCHTYNIDQNVFEPDYLHPWINIEFDSDLVFISVQELDMSATGIVAGRGVTEKGQTWKNNLIETISRKGNYTFLKMEQLCGIVMFSFCKPTLLPLIKNLESNAHGVGKMGLANKGGVAIRFDIFETKIYHDYIIWMGDLNYRVELEDGVVRNLVEQKDYAKLYEHDQLNTCKAKKIVFDGFKEAPINFPPTFKIIVGKDVYIDDRIPSWCDRVLIRTQNAYPCKISNYTSHNLLLSDHKPVSCCFSLFPAKTIPDQFQHVEFKVWKMTDNIEKLIQPKVEFSTTDIVFNDVLCATTYVQQFSITNNGEYPTRLAFSKRPDNNLIAPSYFVIKPLEAVIQPNTTTTFKISLFIHPEHSRIISNKQVDDILSVSLQYGGIVFISTRINFKETIFGQPLKEVVQLQTPFEKTEKSLSTTLANQQIPKEIWRLGYDIVAAAKPDSLIQHTTEENVRIVLNAINTNSFFDTRSCPALLQGMSYFLSALPDSLIPSSKFYDVTTCKTKSDAYDIVNALELENYNLFFYITVLIRQIVEVAKSPTINHQTACSFFSKYIIRHPTSNVIIKENLEKITEFLLNFIEI